MAESKKLTGEDFSNVWKDNENTLPSGLKLDLVQHLLKQREVKEWNDLKQSVIKVMKLEQFNKSDQIQILDIGCGLGIDLLMVAEEASRLDKKIKIIGLDQNSAMIEEAKKLYENKKSILSSSVSIEIMQGDIFQMPFNDETFDIVRSDITLMHVDLMKALNEIKRVLKTNGRLIALEGGAGDFFSSDEIMIKTYDKVLPSRRDGGTAIRLQFILPKMNFEIRSSQPTALLQTGQGLAAQDEGWIKMRGMGEMMVSKGVLTQDESDDFQKRYIQACETNQALGASIMFVIEAVKCK